MQLQMNIWDASEILGQLAVRLDALPPRRESRSRQELDEAIARRYREAYGDGGE